jgi:LPXTG-site transpeptidase (sortase) family protein
MQIQGWSRSPGLRLRRRAGGLLRSALAPGIAVLVAGAALVFQAPLLVDAVAQGCVTPGNDGPNAALTGVVNTYYPATASAASGATSIAVGARLAGASPAIAAGDLLLVIQMQDSDINSTNSIAYGDGTTGRGTTGLRSTGLYEYVAATSTVVAGVVTISGSGVGNGLVNSYDEFTAAPVATHGFRTFQVIRVPQYSSATLGAGLTAAAWDGALHAGGVLAVDVAGALNFNAQTISVNQLGFKGALGVQQAGGAGTGTDYAVPTGGGAHGYKAEGTAGTPRFLYDPIGAAAVNAAADGYPTGDAARGAPGTAGGGGTDSHPVGNDENSGGGGGANGGQGGLGGNSWNTNQPVGGLGGAAFPAVVTRVVLGGGGGAGTRNNSVAFQSSGGTGGGIVMIRTGSVVGAGTINANGGVGVTPTNDGGGGGGAGGSVVVTTNTGTVNGLTIHANGGNGTDAWPLGATGAGNYHGPGGGGGGGVIITSNALPLAQTTVAGGLHGTTTVDLAPYGSVNGNAGLILTTTPAAIPGSSSGAECLPVLTAAKTTSTPNVTNTVGGTTATYSITVSDAANTAAATGVNFSDALPAGFSYASTGSIVLNGGSTRPATVNPVVGDTTPVWGTFRIPASGSVVITFTVNIAASVAPGTYNNPATATYLDPTRTTVGGTTSVSYPGGGGERVTVHAPDMTIAKSHVDPLVRGSTTSTYSLTATNSGNVATSGTVTVTDTLPAGLTPTAAAGAGWTCPAPVGQTITCTRADVLGAGASYPAITVTVTVLQSAANSVTNTASVSGGGQTNTTNDTASDLTNIVSQADIALTKTVNNATPNVGANVIFTVTATNNGPSNATGVVVNDVLPAGLTFVSAAPSAGTSYVAGVWTIGALANGASATLGITATVTGTTAVVNTATKTAETETDPVAGNNSASVTVTGQSADIAITKTVTNATPNLGSNVTFTITATNNGPSSATGVVVTDVLPVGLALVSATPSAGTSYVAGVWTIGALANGVSATLTIVATDNSTSPLTNTATKSAEDQVDPVAGNNSASATVTGQSADIAITKTVSNLTPDFGTNVVFTLTAHNNGPSAATGVVVTDVLPAGLTFVSAAPSAGTTYVAGTWTIGALANGASATLGITVTVNTSAVTTNTATKTAENQPDPAAGNNSASATITPVAADIAITKSVDNTRPNLNTNVTFTITATNNGPSNATGVVVNDVLPVGLTYVSSVASAGTTYTFGTGAWTIGALANGASATLTIVATDTSTSALTNTASKSAETQPDPVAGNNSASVIVTGQAADIAITKTVNNATPNFNSNVTFTVTAHNNGPVNATGVQVTDILPVAGLTYVSSAPSVGTTYNQGTGIWDIGPLANGASATLGITATVTSTAPVTNTAAKSAEDQTDPVAGNNSASATVTPVSADIAIVKTVSSSTPPYLSNVIFTITATNNGPSAATGVQVTDLLPAPALLYVSSTTSGATTYSSLTGLWTIGAMANGATATLTITATVNTLGSATNTATKTAADQVDPVPGNNSSSASVSCCIADIAVTKTVSNATPNFGSPVTFTITAHNNGPQPASGLQLTDNLPVGLTYVSSAPSVGTYTLATGVWDIGGLANGASVTLGITATVNTSAATTNTATKTAENEADNTPLDDSASVTITPVAADIALTKTVSNSAPNQNTNVTFTITATNNGPSDATGVHVADLLPPGLTYVSSVPSGATTYTFGTGDWNIGPLANGTNATLSIVAKVTGNTPVTNTASKSAEVQPDPVPGNNTATATVTGQAADIAVTKTVDNATPNQNTNVTFTITAHNNGPSDATGVEVTDTLPLGLTLVSATPSVGTYVAGTGIWHIGPLANGASVTLSIVATATTTSALVNTATRSAGNQPDPNAANDSASVTVTGQAADIGLTKAVDNSTPNFGTNVTFTVIATNHGPSAATGVVVTDVLPVGLNYVSSTASGATIYNSGSGAWTIGPLANGATATLTITATVNTTSPVTNTATKFAEDQPDPNAANNSASSTITPRAVADIAITKTVSTPTPNFGANVTFVVTAHNNGPNGATGLQVTDLLPPVLTYVSSVPSGVTTYNSGTGLWNIGALANGASATLSITATVNTTAVTTNTATKIAENEVDATAGDDSASAIITPVAADIAITKTVDNATPNQGTNVNFSITAVNNGPSNATGVVVNDLLPPGLTYVSSVASAGTIYTFGTGDWNIGALANGANATLTITATATGTTLVTNTATKTAETQPDQVPANNSASATVTGQAADIAITKTVNNTTPNLGANVIFTVTATNNGPSAATGVHVNDLLPPGVTFVMATPSGATTYNPVTGDWNIGALANGAGATLATTATDNSTAAAINTATKTAEDQTDPVAGNNSASATVTGQAADIAITKTVNNATPNQGTNVIFTITATNNGPSSATGVRVIDLLPAGLNYVSSVPSVGIYTSGTGLWDIGALANAASATLSITATATGTSPVTNTATKFAEDQPDPVAGNNSASVTVTGQAADIAVAKIVNNATPNLGTNVTFTVTVMNNGPSSATGVVVNDLLPPALTFVSATPSTGTYTFGTGDWNIGGLANGANATLSLVATVTTTATSTNTATKTGEVQPDPVAGNNSASVSVTGQAADIAVTKTVSNATPNQNTNVTFTVTATNNGPSNATGVAITDILPPGLTFVLATPSAGTSFNPVSGVWTVGALANGASATLGITATVTGTSLVTNTASKTAEDQPDLVAGNNTASVSVTGQSADIAITKIVDNPVPNVGTNVVFTVGAVNNGPSNATGVRVTDQLPAAFTFVSAVPSAGTTYNPVTGIWDIGALANGASATLSITATSNTATPTTNTATKTAENQPDPNAVNDTASVLVTGQQADIAVAKTVSNTVPNLNTNVTFTITATNNGPSNSTGVVVHDLLPATLTFVSATASGATTYNNGTGDWTIGALANGSSATLSLVATVTTTAATTNTATKTAENQPDPVAGNDSASATVTAQAADIAVGKTVDIASPPLGSNVTFTVTATNNGPSNATGVHVTDVLPIGLTFVSSVGVYNSGTGIWDIGALANGSTATLTITATVNTTVSVTNTATKTAEDQPDPVAGNNSASVTVNPVAADIAITKTVSNITPNQGTNVTFTITATNNGPSNATGVHVTDLLPVGLTYVSSVPSAGTTYTFGTGDWNIGAVANGANATLSIVATVTGTTAVTNTATKTAETQPDPVAGNNSASATVTGQAADIAITKTVSNSTPALGTNVTFTITATNNGPSNATGVGVTDILPIGLTYVSSAPSAGTTYTFGTGAWNIGALANGANATLTITVTVNTTVGVTNTATKTAEDQTDPVPGNNSANASLNAVAADIAVTKTVSNTAPNQNTIVTFTITATNNGPSGATGVHVTDLLPAGLSFASATPSGVTTYNPVTGDWNIGALANGANATLSLAATVTGTTPMTNTATKTAEVESDPVPGNDTASATVTGQAADIGLNKTVSNATPNLGTNVTYTITATNNGPSNATGVQVSDTLPPSLAYVSSVPSGATSYNSGTGVWNIGALANGASATLTITATVNTTAVTTNTASRSAGNQPDPNAGNDTASATITPVSADIAITKSVDNPTPNLFTNVTFTVTATNNGPSNATGVVVTDVLPGTLTYVSSVASQGIFTAGTGVWAVGAIANGGNATLLITANVTGLANSVNTATKTAEVQPDPNTGNDSASSTVACCLADIAVTKTVNNPTPNFGTNVIYTITATNNGPLSASGLQLRDQLPVGLTYVSSAPSVGVYNNITGVWNIGGLANATSATLTITATVNTLAPTTNTASKIAENEADNTAADDSASVTIAPVAADIAITKTVSNTVPNQGMNVTFTITATNNGPSNATGVKVTDLLPLGLTYVSSVPSAGTTYNFSTGVWDIGALANGANSTLTIVATVTGTMPVTNTATKTAEVQSDQVPGNDSATATVTGQAADIAINKTVSNSTPGLGTNVVFTVTATNNGPANATGVQVTDSLPGTLTFVSAAPSAGSYNSGTGVWNIGALANAASATLAITATVNTTGAITNTATKTAGDQPDPNPGNNTASASLNAVAADIAVTKTVSNSLPNQNTNVVFTITATNNGPSNATGVQVTDLVPVVGLTYVSSVASAGTTYNAGTGLWNIGAIANAANATLSITATVTGTNPVTNVATKTAETEADPVAGNNSAAATVTGQAADIAINKTVPNPTPNFGANVTFTVTATNNGPNNATGVQVNDLLPLGLTFVSAVPSGATTYNQGTGLWNIGSLANGATATLTITVTVNTTAATTNTATKTAESQTDPNPGNNTASVTINPVAADVAITKTVSNTTPNQGTNVTFTVTATDNGPSDATGVQVTDLLPAGLTYVSSVPSAGTTYIAGVWNIGLLPNGTTATLSIVATATRTTPVTNTATKTAEAQPDPVNGNNSASATVTGQAADIAIAKVASAPVVALGSNVSFVVTATNNGPSAAGGVQVTDVLPVGLTLVSATPSAGTTYSAGSGLWNIGGLTNGASATLTIVARVTTTTPATNTASKIAENQPDPVAGNNSASATVTGASADISVVKTVNTTTPSMGQNVTYTLVVNNLGPSTATGVQLSDPLPAGVTFVSYTATQGIYNPVTGIWNVGTLVNGAGATLSLVVKVTAMGNIVNTVTVLPGPYLDPNLLNNVSAVTIDPLPGLPNTSAPDAAAGPKALAPQQIEGLFVTVLAIVAGLGALALAGMGWRRGSRFGQRRSRSRRRLSQGRLTLGLIAVVLSLGIASMSLGAIGSPAPAASSTTAAAPATVANAGPGTQLIGSTVVTTTAPAPPQAETFNRVSGPITPSRLRIPTIGVDAWVGAVGLRSDGSMDVPNNLWTSSWLATGPKPGQAGNAVIAAHRGVGSPALFSHLENVRPGDRIYVSDAAGNEIAYSVTAVVSLDLSLSSQREVFAPATAQQLVLITCFGRYVPSARTYDHRLVVVGQPLPPAA